MAIPYLVEDASTFSSILQGMKDISIHGNEMQRKVAPSEVSSLFHGNLLLARAMEQEVTKYIDLDSSKASFCFDSFENEIAYMRSYGKLRNASCTLLVPGSAVSTYKTYGFLLSTKSAEILHVATHDIDSATANDGSLIAPENENISLEALVEHVQNTPDPGMNEVNAHFALDDLYGLFVRKVEESRPLVDILLVQEELKKKGIDLPLYVYDSNKGEMQLHEKTQSEITRLLITTKNKEGLRFAQMVAPSLGFSVSDRGRIQSIGSPA